MFQECVRSLYLIESVWTVQVIIVEKWVLIKEHCQTKWISGKNSDILLTVDFNPSKKKTDL